MANDKAIKPIQIGFAVITRSGNLSPMHIDERITFFRDEYTARTHALPCDRISRVYLFEDDPRVIMDQLQAELNVLREGKGKK